MNVTFSDLKEFHLIHVLVAEKTLKCITRKMSEHWGTCLGNHKIYIKLIFKLINLRAAYQGDTIIFSHWDSQFKHTNPEAGAIMSVTHLPLEKVNKQYYYLIFIVIIIN